MTDKQFKFSMLIGGLTIVLGALILKQATIGLGLLALGAAIALLAVFTKDPGQNARHRALAPIPLEQQARRNMPFES